MFFEDGVGFAEAGFWFHVFFTVKRTSFYVANSVGIGAVYGD
jgi:hypothetical protein